MMLLHRLYLSMFTLRIVFQIFEQKHPVKFYQWNHNALSLSKIILRIATIFVSPISSLIRSEISHTYVKRKRVEIRRQLLPGGFTTRTWYYCVNCTYPSSIISLYLDYNIKFVINNGYCSFPFTEIRRY